VFKKTIEVFKELFHKYPWTTEVTMSHPRLTTNYETDPKTCVWLKERFTLDTFRTPSCPKEGFYIQDSSRRRRKGPY